MIVKRIKNFAQIRLIKAIQKRVRMSLSIHQSKKYDWIGWTNIKHLFGKISVMTIL